MVTTWGVFYLPQGRKFVCVLPVGHGCYDEYEEARMPLVVVLGERRIIHRF